MGGIQNGLRAQAVEERELCAVLHGLRGEAGQSPGAGDGKEAGQETGEESQS